MPINVDPEKMREYFRRNTEYDPDDPRQSAEMLRAFLWFMAGALITAASFAFSTLTLNVSMAVLGVAMIVHGLGRIVSLTRSL